MTDPTTAPAPAAQPDTFVQYWGTSDTHSAECRECGWHGEGRHSRAAAQQDADAHRCDVAPAPAAAGQTQQEHQTEVIAVGEGWCQARCTCGWFDQYVVPARLRASAEYAATCHLRIVGALPTASAPTPEPQGEVVAGRTLGIYFASKSRHAPRWRLLRDEGVHVLSTWIDEAGVGETGDWTGLWERCRREAVAASEFVLYIAEGDDDQRGALVEAGFRLAAGLPVDYVAPEGWMRNLARHPLMRPAHPELRAAVEHAVATVPPLAAPPAAAPSQREQALREALEGVWDLLPSEEFVGDGIDGRWARRVRDTVAAARALAATPSREAPHA